MIQRLLRGKALYVGLGALTVLLYLRALHVGSLHPLDIEASHATFAPSPPPAIEGAVPQDDTLAWWPSTLNAESLRRFAAQEPSLGISLVFLAIFTIGMGGWGLGLAVAGARTGRIRWVWRFHSHPLPQWTFGELGRITLLALLVGGLIPLLRLPVLLQHVGAAAESRLWIPVSMLLLDLCVILAILAFAVGKGSSVRSVLGCSTRHLVPAVAVGFRGYVAVFPWMFILLLATVEAMRLIGWTPPPEPIQELIFHERDPWVLAWMTLLACVVAPVAEELFFRGVLYPAIRRRMSRMAAMAASGAAFSLIHMNPTGFLSILLIGCLLAHLYERTGSLLSPLAIHMLHNTFLMAAALVLRRLLLLTG